MQSYFIAFSQMIQQVWNFISNLLSYFFGLFRTLGSYLEFIMNALGTLPFMVRVPATIILIVMVIKFVLNLGKN